MDDQVLAAMARWPNVPAVYGWLSLSPRGHWRLHPRGDGWDPGTGDDPSNIRAGAAAPPGEAITSPAILAFIGRNYQADAAGRWYFQNGPQRVYVRLDAAPWILHTAIDAGQPGLVTHTGRPFGPITHWWLSEDGLLYAQSGLGAGLIEGRDLPQLLDALVADDGQPPESWLDPTRIAGRTIRIRFAPPPSGPASPAPLGILHDGAIEATLGFIRRPSVLSG